MQAREHREVAVPGRRRVPNGGSGLRGLPGRAGAGQSLIETCLALFLICLLFATFFQVSQILAAREVLQHAAARGAREKIVGFNRWMVEKCINTALIPNSGRLLTPDYENVNQPLRDLTATLAPGKLWDTLLGLTPTSVQQNLERARIPDYLASETAASSRAILDYERWQDDSIDYTTAGTVEDEVQMTVHQKLPLTVPLHRAMYADDTVKLAGETRIENHFPLYIDDENL